MSTKNAVMVMADKIARRIVAGLYVDDCEQNGDKRIEYAKGKRDELILSIVGPENFVPFDVAYGAAYFDELRRIRLMNGGEH